MSGELGMMYVLLEDPAEAGVRVDANEETVGYGVTAAVS